MEQKYNLRSPAVKRLMKEAQELHQPTEEFYAHPLEDNLFEWHFTVRGQPESDFDGGLYHGRIILPPEYPMKPPSIILLTPNGRFEVNKKICLSISGHHPESWQPCWSIRTALLAIIGFMPTPGKGAIGSLDYTPKERQILAKKSQNWKCHACGPIKDCLMKRTESFSALNQEAKELATQISFKSEADSAVADVKNGIAIKENQKVIPIESLAPLVKNIKTETSLENIVANSSSAEPVTEKEFLSADKQLKTTLDASSANATTSSVQVCGKNSSCDKLNLPVEGVPRQRHQRTVEDAMHNQPSIVPNEFLNSNVLLQRKTSNMIIFVIILVIIGLLFRRLIF